MADNTHGGARQGAGRKRKADIENANNIFLSMIKKVHSLDTDEEAKIQLARTLYSFERGQMFIAEHIFGKAKEIVSFDDDTITEIKVTRINGVKS